MPIIKSAYPRLNHSGITTTNLAILLIRNHQPSARRVGDFMAEFSFYLKFAREEEGWTQTELALKVGLKPSAISHFENGRRKPSTKNLVLLANALKVTTDFLLGLEGNPGW